MLRYVVTLTFDLLTLESCHVKPIGCSIRVPSLNIIWLTVPYYVITYWALGCVQKCDLWRGEETKKGQKLSCVKLAIWPDHPRRRRPLKFCMRGHVQEVVIYFKFHENRSRGLRAVEGRISPSPIDLAHGLYNSLYYRTSRDFLEYRAAKDFQLTKHYLQFILRLATTNLVAMWQWRPKVALIRVHINLPTRHQNLTLLLNSTQKMKIRINIVTCPM